MLECSKCWATDQMKPIFEVEDRMRHRKLLFCDGCYKEFQDRAGKTKCHYCGSPKKEEAQILFPNKCACTIAILCRECNIKMAENVYALEKLSKIKDRKLAEKAFEEFERRKHRFPKVKK